MMAWLRKKASKTKGFSLPEVIVSLFIFCIILSLGSLRLEDFKRQLVLENAVKEVATAIEQAGHVNAINGQEINVSYFPKSHKLIFYGKDYAKRLSLDEHISVSNLTDFSVAKNGTIAPRTVTFSDGHHQKHLKIQMNWGKIIYETS